MVLPDLSDDLHLDLALVSVHIDVRGVACCCAVHSNFELNQASLWFLRGGRLTQTVSLWNRGLPDHLLVRIGQQGFQRES